MSSIAEKCYDFESGQLGFALIFNHFVVSSNIDRVGTNCDRDRLSDVLIKYGFIVKCFNDYNKSQIMKILSKVSKFNHKNNNCLLVIVMTHGTDSGLLYASDDTYEVKKLFEPFYKCNSLHRKPKMFFIQACQGISFDTGAQYGCSPDRSERGDTRDLPHHIPTKEDYFFMYSSAGGYVSVRDTDGSWFIQSLCKQLEEHFNIGGIKHHHLAVKTSQEVAYVYEKPYTKQMPRTCSTLRKIVYFKPKPSSRLFTTYYSILFSISIYDKTNFFYHFIIFVLPLISIFILLQLK